MPWPPGTVTPLISSIARIAAPRPASAIRNSLPLSLVAPKTSPPGKRHEPAFAMIP
jgi:hypothetical protein